MAGYFVLAALALAFPRCASALLLLVLLRNIWRLI